MMIGNGIALPDVWRRQPTPSTLEVPNPAIRVAPFLILGNAMPHAWALILAGGHGSRLRSITAALSGDDRPKQFCRLLSGATLLDDTRRRCATVIDADRTVLVLTEPHRPFYADVVAALPADRYVEQPDNRGTAAAIAAGLARVRRQAPEAVVAVFPSDHYYRTPEAVADAVRHAVAHAALHRSQLVLVGAEADSAEGDYGWIEPGNDDDGDGVHPVLRFWEKPGRARAAELLDRGCLWNTFITVGTVDAFDAALRSAAPDLLAMSLSLTLARTRASETAVARATYARLESRCFSKTVLAQQPCAVVRMTGAGWLDVGDPERLASAWTDQARDQRTAAAARPPATASGLSLADALPV